MSAPGMSAIELRNVRKTFRVKGGLLGKDRHVVAVDDISFAVPTGGVLGIVRVRRLMPVPLVLLVRVRVFPVVAVRVVGVCHESILAASSGGSWRNRGCRPASACVRRMRPRARRITV